jgi:hypothetical protein
MSTSPPKMKRVPTGGGATMTTLVFSHHGQIGGRQFRHGEELPPGLIPREVIDHWLDQGWLKEYSQAERPSLYRLFPRFSGIDQLTEG